MSLELIQNSVGARLTKMSMGKSPIVARPAPTNSKLSFSARSCRRPTYRPQFLAVGEYDRRSRLGHLG